MKSYRQQLPMKQLVIRRIPNEQQPIYKEKVETLFMDPKNYFDTFCDGKQVIIGKKKKDDDKYGQISNNLKSRHKSIFYQAPKQKHLNYSRSSSKYNKLGVSSQSNISSQKANNLPNNKQTISENDLIEIFDGFKKDKKDNALPKIKNKDRNEMIDEFCVVSKNQINQIFNTQENALQKHDLENKKNAHISKVLAKKIKRPTEQLLMNKTQDFRTIKEFRDKLSQEVHNNSPRPPYEWALRLRDEHSDHFVNVGTKFPQWYVYHFSTAENETVRNPRHFALNSNDLNLFKNEGYMKKKISKRVYKDIKTDFTKTNFGFNTMSLKGKDLLDFEIEHAKNFKKKLLNLPKKTNNNIFQQGENCEIEFFGNNENFKELMKTQSVKKIID